VTERVASGAWVETAVGLAMEKWTRAAGQWGGDGPQYSIRDQKLREKAYDRALDDVRRACRRRVPNAEPRLTSCFARFAAEALDLGPEAIDLLNQGFLPVGMQLTRWAHRFDPELSQADITQAARNAWTACGMQPLFGAPLRLTPAILAYSLLYPYSDNYLDQRDVAPEDKVWFSERFRSRLRGALHAADPREARIWAMVRMIEDEFPRAEHPEVFDALLAIHGAQEESVRQLENCGEMEEGELMRISCAKGGTSVLADACLVRGELDAAESELAFLWGVMLQLGDDLQDIGEDLERGSDTLFTRAVCAGRPLDALAEQLLNFAGSVAARMDALGAVPNIPDSASCFPTLGREKNREGGALDIGGCDGLATHKALLRMSWRSLILMAVGQAHQYFTAEFVARMERFSPFRFAFLRKRREKLQGDRGLLERLFAIVLTSEGENAVTLPAPELAGRSIREAVSMLGR
jgi:hypothetical protein